MSQSDSNVLFAMVALQLGLLEPHQFTSACTLWTIRKSEALPSALLRKGWITEADQTHLSYLVERKIEKHGGDIPAAIGSMPAQMREALAVIDDDLTYHVDPVASSGMPETVLLPRTRVSDRYDLMRLYAAGGIGEIWLARDESLNREVAIKRLQSNQSDFPSNRTRFLREARITGQLDHPGVVPVYELCVDEPSAQPYYAMRFIKGQTLAEAIRSYHEKRGDGSDDTRTFLMLLNAFLIACNTVSYAHSKGIVHRDLKSANIVLGDFGEVMVVDWGLAKVVNRGTSLSPCPEVLDTCAETSPERATATLPGHILGTPAYMAPEQADGLSELIGPRTDVYGLCAILYEILSGRAPFIGENTLDVLQKVRNDDPMPPSDIAVGVPPELEEICLRGLAKSPASRQKSPDEVAASVQRWIADLIQRKRSQEERERFFALSLDLLAVCNEEGFLKQSSPAWHRLLGLSAPELAEKPLTALIHPDDRRLVDHKLGSVVQTQKAAFFEARCVTVSGRQHWVVWSAMWEAAERLVYLVGHDITDLKRSEQRLLALLEWAPDAFVVNDPAGQIVLVNSRTQKIFGYERHELEGQSMDVLIPERFRGSGWPLRETFSKMAGRREAESSERVVTARCKDGKEILVAMMMSVIHTDSGSLFFSTFRDFLEQ